MEGIQSSTTMSNLLSLSHTPVSSALYALKPSV